MTFANCVKTHEANVFGRLDASLYLIRHRLLLADSVEKVGFPKTLEH
jgi:hypothetical protein